MEKEINIKHVVAIIRRRLWIMILFTIIVTSIGAAYTLFFKTPLYASSSRIIIPATNESMNTLKVMVNEPAVLEKVAAQLSVNRSASALSGQISTENVEGSQIVKINVIDEDPALAAEIANTTAVVYKQEAANLLHFENVSILSEAKVSQHAVPININHQKTIMMAFCIGFVLSIGLIFLLDSLDDTIKSERSIETLLDIPTLGSISKMNKRNTADKYSKKISVPVREVESWLLKEETKSRKKA